MTSEFIKTRVIEHSPLNIYQVEFDKPQGWEGMIAELQEAYLHDRSSTSARVFDETVEELMHLSIVKHQFEPEQTDKRLALAFATLNMEQLFLLLKDPLVTEILSNKIGNDIIITHREHGRCITNLKFDKNLWKALKIRAEYDTGRPINAENPALKLGMKTSLGNLRISLQTNPLSVLGPTFSLRRLPSQAIPLDVLIKEGQISKEDASTLVNALHRRENIIIAGEPGSGKTTLANALLQLAHKSWRLITLEDAREISLDSKRLPLLIQYSMPPVGASDRYTYRSNEIARLLHRSPDYVFLGEIQNREDTTVAFEGFAAGIRGMATTHARNIDGLQSRWVDSHELAEDLLKSIDWIVMTSRTIDEGKINLGIQGIYQLESGRINEI